MLGEGEGNYVGGYEVGRGYGVRWEVMKGNRGQEAVR